MILKLVVDNILKEKNRSLSWLAGEMDKTFEGLKLSLVKETIKYKDIRTMARILDVSPSAFFKDDYHSSYLKDDMPSKFAEAEGKYTDLQNNLKNCKEIVSVLKDQLKDKEKIISLLNKE